MEKEYQYKLPQMSLSSHLPGDRSGFAIAERLERMVEEQAQFHIDLLGALKDVVLEIRFGATGR